MKTLSRSKKIEQMLKQGKPPAEIASTLGCTRQNVYAVRHMMKKKAKPAKRKYTKRVKPMPISLPIELVRVGPTNRTLWQRIKDFFA